MDYLSLQQAADELGVSRTAAFQWCLRGWLRYEQIAGRYVITRTALTDFRSGPEGHRAKRHV